MLILAACLQGGGGGVLGTQGSRLSFQLKITHILSNIRTASEFWTNRCVSQTFFSCLNHICLVMCRIRELLPECQPAILSWCLFILHQLAHFLWCSITLCCFLDVCYLFLEVVRSSLDIWFVRWFHEKTMICSGVSFDFKGSLKIFLRFPCAKRHWNGCLITFGLP